MKSVYEVKNFALGSVSTIRDLGIQVQNNWQYVDHISKMCTKGMGAWFAINKTIKQRNPLILLKAYKTYVRPILEFASVVWSPYLKKDITKVEKVQARITRIIFQKCFGQSPIPCYSERLRKFNLLSLQQRRINQDLIFAFKLLKGELSVSFSKYYAWRPTRGRISSFELHVPFSKLNPYFHSFFIRTAKWLNKLPDKLLRLPSSKSLSRRLKSMDRNDLLTLLDISAIESNFPEYNLTLYR